ncbi:MAG TPA: hypothetical protein VEQ85_15145 [Lacipirellulaceae bacterium]|nr:hypothetical protein [Lacipirellulaceae bacterium]
MLRKTFVRTLAALAATGALGLSALAGGTTAVDRGCCCGDDCRCESCGCADGSCEQCECDGCGGDCQCGAECCGQ